MKLNAEQEAALELVTDERTKARAKEATALAELAAEIQQPVRRAVQRAVELGIPTRQIGFALGTSDYKTVKSYYAVADGLTMERLEDIE